MFKTLSGKLPASQIPVGFTCTSYYARYDGREDVDGAFDSGRIIVVAKEEYSASYRSGVRPA